MRLALISDIHGNFVALEAALSRIALYAPDRIICLGDVAQGGPEPRESVQALREGGYPVVMGNADDWLITGTIRADSTESAASPEQEEVRLWSLEQLGDENIDFLRSRPSSIDVPISDRVSVCCVHGTLRSFNEVIDPETPVDQIKGAFADTAAPILTGGHTHFQWMRRWKHRLFFNPGSIGLPYERHLFDDGNEPMPFIEPWAEFAVLTATDQDVSVEFGKTPLHPHALKQAVTRSGRPHAEIATAQYRSY